MDCSQPITQLQVEQLEYLDVSFQSDKVSRGWCSGQSELIENVPNTLSTVAERWVMIKRTRSMMQGAEMNFFHSMAGLSFRALSAYQICFRVDFYLLLSNLLPVPVMETLGREKLQPKTISSSVPAPLELEKLDHLGEVRSKAAAYSPLK